MASSHTTTDHDEIRTWAEGHGGRPVKVDTKGGKGKDDHGGVLRIDFQEKDDAFTDIDWDEWFEIFEESNLAMLIGEGDSRFNKLIAREGSPRGK